MVCCRAVWGDKSRYHAASFARTPSERIVATRVPRELTKKYTALSCERDELRVRLSQIDEEIRALDYAIAVLDPQWKPLAKARRRSPNRWPTGKLTATCLRLLRQQPGLSSAELARRASPHCGVVLETRRQRHDLASAITTAMRRHERKGLVEVAGTDETTGVLLWRIRDLSVAKAVAG